MLKVAELEIKMSGAGKITVPPEVIKERDIHEGDVIRLIYLRDCETRNEQSEQSEEVKEFFLVDGQADAGAMIRNQADLQITRGLLEMAGIPSDADLQVECLDGEIVICQNSRDNLAEITEVKQAQKGIVPEQILPVALLKVLMESGIPQENIRMVFHMPGDLGKENRDD